MHTSPYHKHSHCLTTFSQVLLDYLFPRICLTYRDCGIRWKFRHSRRARAPAHAEWNATHLDFVLWEDLYAHLHVAARFQAFRDFQHADKIKQWALRSVARSKPVMDVIYRFYMQMVERAQADTRPPCNFYA